MVIIGKKQILIHKLKLQELILKIYMIWLKQIPILSEKDL